MSPKAAAFLTRLNAIGFALFALFWAGAAFPGLDGPARFLLDLLDWPLDGTPATLDHYVRWLSAIGAGLTAAFAAISYFVVAPAIERNDSAARNGALAAIAAWFAVDSAGSIASGVASNAVFNAVFFALYAAPLLAMRPLHAAGRQAA
jgi:hypothetical protein